MHLYIPAKVARLSARSRHVVNEIGPIINFEGNSCHNGILITRTTSKILSGLSSLWNLRGLSAICLHSSAIDPSFGLFLTY